MLSEEDKKIVKDWLEQKNFAGFGFYEKVIADEGYGDIMALEMATGKRPEDLCALHQYVLSD